MLCVLCPKDNKKEASFIYTGNSYCNDCYYIRRQEVENLKARAEKDLEEYRKERENEK